MGGVFLSSWWRGTVVLPEEARHLETRRFTGQQTYLGTVAEKTVSRIFASMAVTERALVDVAITGKGDGTYQDGATREKDEVKVTTNRGHSVWVSEKDVYARKPNPEEKDPA